MDKIRRHQAIIEILGQGKVSSQEILREMLAARGIKVTQATLSRDFRELGIGKSVAEDGGYRYAVQGLASEGPIASCEVGGSLLVMKTEPGLAPAIAYRIDGLHLKGVLGTVAGENTLLVVVAEDHEPESVREQLWKHIWR